jgi:hypothetical protein
MDKAKAVAVIALGGGAAYFLFLRRNPQTGQSAFDDLISPNSAYAQGHLPMKGPGNTSVYGPAVEPNRTTAVIGAIGAGSVLVGSLLGSGGTVAAASGAAATAASGGVGGAAAVGGGIGVAGTIAITGGIAGGVLLTWAVWKKGLFRGGEEALLVNPDRDQFLSQFGPRWQGEGKGGPTWEASGNGRLAALLFEIDHDSTQRLWKALAAADHIDEFEAATRDIQRLLAANGINVQAP